MGLLTLQCGTDEIANAQYSSQFGPRNQLLRR